jgi:hypothetical protein
LGRYFTEIQDPTKTQIWLGRQSRSASTYLDGAHGGVESREAIVKGAKDGDDDIGDLLALVDGLTQQRRALCEGLHLPIHQAAGWIDPPPVESMFTCGGR